MRLHKCAAIFLPVVAFYLIVWALWIPNTDDDDDDSPTLADTPLPVVPPHAMPAPPLAPVMPTTGRKIIAICTLARSMSTWTSSSDSSLSSLMIP